MAEYDQMGNYVGYDDSYGYDTMAQPTSPQFYDDFGNPVANAEEERRKREEIERQIEAYKKQQKELGSEVRNKQEVTTYADGSQTITTKREVPGQTAKSLQPVSPGYNESIAQQESGGRADIGYHDRSKGTAAGMYGMTDAGYADARRRDPSLPADRLQSSAEQQTQAMNAYTQQNAKYLQNYGVEPTQNNLAAAHFLGAKGLSDYLKTGYISPQAAAANGGEANVRRIVDQRLGGQTAPASGAVKQPVQPVQPQQQTQPQAQAAKPQLQPVSPQAVAQAAKPQTEPAQEAPRMEPNSYDEFGTPRYSPEQAELDKNLKTFETIQNDPKALMNFEGPEWMQNNAKMRAADIMADQRGNQKAQETLATATPTDLARYLQGKTKQGEDYNLATRVRAMLFAAAGQKELSMREMNKLDTVGTDKYIQGSDGKAYLVRQRADGEIMGGFNAETGKKLSAEDIVKVGAGTQGAGKLNIVGGSYVNDKTGEVGRLVSDERTGLSYIQTDTGRKPMAGFRPQGQSGTMDMQKAQQVQKQNIDLAGDWAKLQMKIQGAAPEAANKYLGEFNAKYNTQFGLQSIAGSAPQISMETGQMTQGAPMAVQGAPMAAPTQAAAATTGAAGQKLAPVSPADLEAQKKKIAETEKVERELGQKSSEGVIKHRDEKIVPAAMAGQDGSDAVKRQFKLINEPTSDALFGLYNKAQSNSATDKNWAIIRDWLGGKLDPNDQTQISKALAAVKLDSNEIAAKDLYLAENTRLANAMIKSGVYGTGASISSSDRESAERAQLDINTTPALAVFAGKSQQLFGFDMARAKSDWAVDKKFDAVDQLERAWRKEENKLIGQYGKVADERNAFIKANSDGKPATIGLVRKAYQMYPVPQYDPNLNAGEGGWRNMPDRIQTLKQKLKGNQ